MASNAKYIAESFIWSVIAKILDAGFKFITIPLLLNYFGVDDYGLLSLAIATNAYIQLLNMGVNTGAVKFFSQWISDRNYSMINRVARTNITFYLAIGLLNSLVLVMLAVYGESVFEVTIEQFKKFRILLLILAGISVFNWVTFVFNQLLIANEQIIYTQKILVFKTFLNLVLVILTIYFQLDIVYYFTLLSILNASIFLPYFISCKKSKLIQAIWPGFYWNDFSIVLKYSLTIFAMGIFQYTAMQSRPIILGIFSKEGISILSEYRIIEVFPIFIASIGGMLISILLPKASKAIHENNKKILEKLAYTGTKYTSILMSILCFPIILSASDLLNLYVGSTYMELSLWLSVWVFTLILSLHNSPVASLVLASGRTRMLVYSSAISCTLSILINIIMCPYIGVGSAVIGYLVYVILQIGFYYFYFNAKVLQLKSFKVFKAFVIPVLIASLSFIIVYLVNLNINENLILSIVARAGIWLLIFALLLHVTREVEFRDIYAFVKENVPMFSKIFIK